MGDLTPREFYTALTQLREDIREDVRADVGQVREDVREQVGGVREELKRLNSKTDRNISDIAAQGAMLAAQAAEIASLRRAGSAPASSSIAPAPSARADEAGGIMISIPSRRGKAIATAVIGGVLLVVETVLHLVQAWFRGQTQ